MADRRYNEEVKKLSLLELYALTRPRQREDSEDYIEAWLATLFEKQLQDLEEFLADRW